MLIPIVLFVLSCVAVLSGTAAVAIRVASRTHLIDALTRAGRENRLASIESNERALELSATSCRALTALLFVVTLSIGLDATDPWFVQPLRVLLASMLWLFIVAIAIPAAWARYAGETFIARALPLMEVVRRLCAPVLLALNAIDEIVRRLAGAPRDAVDRTEQMERDILDAVSEAETAGAVDEAEREMIESVIDLNDMTVGEIMTPRTDMHGVEANADFDQARRLAVEGGHSRLPVYERSFDRIIGVLYAKDLLKIGDTASFRAREAMRAVPFVPESKDVNALLREFQANHVHIAIVLDEFGGTAGLVTIEDILEELVGEITDEHDAAPDLPPVLKIDPDTADIDARLRINEVNEQLDIVLPEDESYDTVAGLVFSRLGHVPATGEGFTENDVHIEVVEVDERTIKRLRIRRGVRAPER
ncbi:MAG: hemolysin family protein [Phycisphaerae bacterium]